MQDLIIQKGKTFAYTLRWGVPPFLYKPITDIEQAAPALVTCPSHGIVDGWPVAIVSVKGMTQINGDTPPRGRDFRKSTVKSVDTVEFNEINAADYSSYKSGGYLQYLTPFDLADYEARMSIKDAIGGTELFRLDTDNGRISLNNLTKTITLDISATVTAEIQWRCGITDLELISADGMVTSLFSASVVVLSEVTTS